MTLNTVVKLPDGRIGTICYHNLDGDGGVWGVHSFVMPANGFGDELPVPDFMLREKSVEASLKRGLVHKSTMECVGSIYELVDKQVG